MDYTATLTSLVSYYANLLIVQYHNKPKATATIALMANLLFANMALLQVRDAFDWQTATGVQLDIIGAWVGVDRFYKGQLFDFRPWFALIDTDIPPDNLQGGFSEISNFNTNLGGFLDTDNILPTQNQMVDSAFRTMIGLKIIKNNINCTCKAIDDAIWNYFDGQVYTVWGVNTLTYFYPASLSEILQVAQDKNVLPCPTGVQLILREIIENVN